MKGNRFLLKIKSIIVNMNEIISNMIMKKVMNLVTLEQIVKELDFKFIT